MKSLFARGTAAVLIAATALTAACSNNDPTAPAAAPQAARAPGAAGPVHASGYLVAWGRDGGTTSGATGTAGTVGSTPGGTTGGASTNGGYLVAWGRDGATQP